MPGPLLKPGAEKDIDIPGGGSDRPVLGWGRLAGPLDPFLFLSLPRNFLLFGEWELDSDGWKLAVSLDSGCQVEGEKCRAVSAVMGRTRVGCLEKGGWGPHILQPVDKHLFPKDWGFPPFTPSCLSFLPSAQTLRHTLQAMCNSPILGPQLRGPQGGDGASGV